MSDPVNVEGANASTHNVSVYLTGSGSSVQLAHGDTLGCFEDYYQDGGTLETMDASVLGGMTCSLVCTAGQGTATIVNTSGSSKVIINLSNVGFGNLNVNAATLNLGGQLILAIDAANPGTQDSLTVTGVTNIAFNTALTVSVNNPPPMPNQGPWVIIKDTTGNIQGDFFKPITTIPQTALTAQVDPDNPKQYILNS